MKLKNILTAGLIVAGMGLGAISCTDDLDRLPSDSKSLTWTTVESDPDTYLPQVLAKCYSVLAVSGQEGAGNSDLSGLDNGTGCYSRAIYMLNEFPTDETLWIWTDAGVVDLVTGTWGNGNINIYGTYSRLYVAIAICNDFIRNLKSSGVDFTSPTELNSAKQYILEARALRALSYWYVLDLFGNGGWVDDNMAYGDSPTPILRRDLYDRLVTELNSILNEWPDNLNPVYGRIGKDAVKMLLAKVYLNAKVYTDGEVDGYADCLSLCNEIILQHQGGGFKNSGLAENYLGLFSANNDRYMPGGSATSENEIIWGVPYHGVYTQSYGGTTFLIAAAVTSNGENDNFVMNCQDLGAANFNWKCMHARKEFSDKFVESGDTRDDLWYKEANGFSRENTTFSDFASGYASIKFTNVRTKDDGTYELKNPAAGTFPTNFVDDAKGNDVNFADTDLPIFRLADVYLMKAECYVMGNQGNLTDALEAVNFVRERAGCTRWTTLTADNLLDERARELYWENHRRTDLIRFGKWISGYTWSWKGNVAEGTDFRSYCDVYPIPANVIAAQPEFAAIQNPGY